MSASIAAQNGDPWEMKEETVRGQAQGLEWSAVLEMLHDEYGMVLKGGVFRKQKRKTK